MAKIIRTNLSDMDLITVEDGGAIAAEIVVFRSLFDDALVVQVDTPYGVGLVRIALNEGIVYEGDPEA